MPETRQQRISALQSERLAQFEQEEVGDEYNECLEQESNEQAQIDALRSELQDVVSQLRRPINRGTPQTENSNSPVESVLKTLQTPSVLRDLQCFDGNPIKLHQFLKGVDSVLPVLEMAKNSPIFNVWMQVIRSKIIGDADTVLELYGTDLSWKEIKTCLITHYNNKRDEVSLTRDLFMLKQIGSIEEFFSKVSHMVTLLINQLNLNETNVDVRTAKQKDYQAIGLKVFVAGLKDPIGPIIRAQAPRTMKDALRLCLEENNYSYVKNPFKIHTPTIPPKPTPSQTPMFRFPQQQQPQFRFPSQQQFPQHQPPRPFPRYQNPSYPQQNRPTHFPNQRSNSNPHSFRPQPFPAQNLFRPQPSGPGQNSFIQRNTSPLNPHPSTSPSTKTHKINYMNRPNFHVEEDAYGYSYYPYTEYDDTCYYYNYDYPDDYEQQNAVHDSQSYTTAEEPVEEKATIDTVTKQIDQLTVDDLNFQAAGEPWQAT